MDVGFRSEQTDSVFFSCCVVVSAVASQHSRHVCPLPPPCLSPRPFPPRPRLLPRWWTSARRTATEPRTRPSFCVSFPRSSTPLALVWGLSRATKPRWASVWFTHTFHDTVQDQAVRLCRGCVLIFCCGVCEGWGGGGGCISIHWSGSDCALILSTETLQMSAPPPPQKNVIHKTIPSVIHTALPHVPALSSYPSHRTPIFSLHL